MVRLIRPSPIHWPAAFWKRAEGSWVECDLLCHHCHGSGCQVSRDDAWEGITVEDAACPCRSSGLLVPARQLPDDPEEIWAAEEAGGCWLAWIGQEGDGLLWPQPWCWRLSSRWFAILHDVYLGGSDVLAFMSNRDVLIGLHELDEGSRCRLEAVFRLACGEEAEVPTFVMPRRSS